MFEFFGADALTALLQVILIDLVLAGDNAIVIGLAAAGLPEAGKAILIGIVAATVLRILFAGLTAQILQVVGLLFAGGILLLWVCWKMWRELRASSAEPIKAMQAAGSSCRNKSRWQAPENAGPSNLADHRG